MSSILTGLMVLTSLRGLLNCMRLSLRLLSGPSTRTFCSLQQFSRWFHKGCLDRALGLPTMITPYLCTHTHKIVHIISAILLNYTHIFHLLLLPGSGQRHIETTWVVQEADALVLISSDTRQDDEVLLPALERIYTGDLHLLQTHRGQYITSPCAKQPLLYSPVSLSNHL